MLNFSPTLLITFTVLTVYTVARITVNLRDATLVPYPLMVWS